MSRLGRDDGSFTIEASLLLPMIMFITLLLLFFSLYSYQKSMLLHVGSAAAERAAYNWDNSYKDAMGTFSKEQYDSLYWRIGEDHLLGSLFGQGPEYDSVRVELPDQNGGRAASASLPEKKLGQSAAMVPTNMSGAIKYIPGISGRKVTTKLEHLLDLPVLDEILADGGVPVVEAQSLVVEPAEFIRTVDLLRYYGAKLKGKGGESGSALSKEELSKMGGKLKQ